MLAVAQVVQAYIHNGMWIADCCRRDCKNAEELAPGQAVYHCTNCRQVATVEWPADADDIWAALSARPVPQTRHWAPAGHRQAIACGVPDGQTAADLRAETAQHMGSDA